MLFRSPLAEYNMNSALFMGNPSFVQFKPLPYAEQEVQIAASCLNASYFTKEKASLTLFEGCAQDAPSLLHMATHGIFYEISASTGSNDWNQAFLTMEKSGLILANDTLLSCNKISSFDFSNTYLIVLSACQTGKSHFHSVEGAYGLRRAFRLAGCHTMILTLWQVDDRCGCFLMNYFYKHLIEESCHPKQAFFLALNELRNYEENNQRPFAHPYYWAGYIFIE